MKIGWPERLLWISVVTIAVGFVLGQEHGTDEVLAELARRVVVCERDVAQDIEDFDWYVEQLQTCEAWMDLDATLEEIEKEDASR